MRTRPHRELRAVGMSVSIRVLAFTVFATILLGACQPLPRPFQPLIKTSASVPPALDGKLGLFLAGIDNASPVFEADFMEILGDELTALGVVASSAVANQGSYLLVGLLSTPQPKSIRISWRIIAADGTVVGLFEQVGATDEAASEKLVRDAARRISSLMKAGDPTKPAHVLATLPAVVLFPVDGAPGDGRVSLTSAMQVALARRSIRVSDNWEDDSLLLLGSVRTSVRAEGQLVRIHWSVINNEGHEIGSVTQSNVVPFGTLDGSWGEIADVVADGGADGVMALLREAHNLSVPTTLD